MRDKEIDLFLYNESSNIIKEFYQLHILSSRLQTDPGGNEPPSSQCIQAIERSAKFELIDPSPSSKLND